ncbi:MAG: GNAT family N-acetyltransferase [Clostridium sp.]|nr:GNAT family N-acetyltransferase [Clostridium sp.]
MQKYGLSYYENAENIVDTAIMEKDKITFCVLMSIVNNKCSKVFTDHEKIIICHSCNPWPVWIWTAPGINKNELNQINECLEKEFPLNKGYTYNLSYETTKQIVELSSFSNDIVIKTNLLSYCCNKLVCIPRKCDGMLRLAHEDDINSIAKIIRDFSYEVEKKELSQDICRNSAEQKIKNKQLYVWETGDNEIAATTSYNLCDGLGKIALVYTLPKFRRSGYAENLVYTVTKKIIDKKHLPVLYTDGDYDPSNNCYQKLGYKKVGRLCTIGINASKIIMLRGNSGSGKSTAAKTLQKKLGRGTLLISQDVVRREMLYVNDGTNRYLKIFR